jgi:hypothetical protein
MNTIGDKSCLTIRNSRAVSQTYHAATSTCCGVMIYRESLVMIAEAMGSKIPSLDYVIVPRLPQPPSHIISMSFPRPQLGPQVISIRHLCHWRLHLMRIHISLWLLVTHRPVLWQSSLSRIRILRRVLSPQLHE